MKGASGEGRVTQGKKQVEPKDTGCRARGEDEEEESRTTSCVQLESAG